MVNITQKNTTLRKAVAKAILNVSKQETINAIQTKGVPKGDVFEFSRAAGLLAIKKTSDVIPDRAGEKLVILQNTSNLSSIVFESDCCDWNTID